MVSNRSSQKGKQVQCALRDGTLYSARCIGQDPVGWSVIHAGMRNGPGRRRFDSIRVNIYLYKWISEWGAESHNESR